VSVDLTQARRMAPVLALVVTVALGWAVFVRPLSSDRNGAEARLAALRQREAALLSAVAEPSAPAADRNPALLFDSRIAVTDPTAVVVERLAGLASDVRARALLIETVEGSTQTGTAAPALSDTYRPDPRFGLFAGPVAYTTIRMSFEVDYAGLGRFLWAFRDLPTIVEVRTLNVQPRVTAADAGARPSGDVLQASLTFFAYTRPQPGAAPGSATQGAAAE
jgi:hypothetical protein